MAMPSRVSFFASRKQNKTELKHYIQWNSQANATRWKQMLEDHHHWTTRLSLSNILMISKNTKWPLIEHSVMAKVKKLFSLDRITSIIAQISLKFWINFKIQSTWHSYQKHILIFTQIHSYISSLTNTP